MIYESYSGKRKENKQTMIYVNIEAKEERLSEGRRTSFLFDLEIFCMRREKETYTYVHCHWWVFTTGDFWRRDGLSADREQKHAQTRKWKQTDKIVSLGLSFSIAHEEEEEEEKNMYGKIPVCLFVCFVSGQRNAKIIRRRIKNTKRENGIFWYSSLELGFDMWSSIVLKWRRRRTNQRSFARHFIQWFT